MDVDAPVDTSDPVQSPVVSGVAFAGGRLTGVAGLRPGSPGTSASSTPRASGSPRRSRRSATGGSPSRSTAPPPARRTAPRGDRPRDLGAGVLQRAGHGRPAATRRRTGGARHRDHPPRRRADRRRRRGRPDRRRADARGRHGRRQGRHRQGAEHDERQRQQRRSARPAVPRRLDPGRDLHRRALDVERFGTRTDHLTAPGAATEEPGTDPEQPGTDPGDGHAPGGETTVRQDWFDAENGVAHLSGSTKGPSEFQDHVVSADGALVATPKPGATDKRGAFATVLHGLHAGDRVVFASVSPNITTRTVTVGRKWRPGDPASPGTTGHRPVTCRPAGRRVTGDTVVLTRVVRMPRD